MILGACEIGGCGKHSIDFNVILVIALGLIVLAVVIYSIYKAIISRKK